MDHCLACGELILPDELVLKNVFKGVDIGSVHDELACNYDVRKCECGNRFVSDGTESQCEPCVDANMFS